MLSKFLMLDRRRGSARRECGAAAAAAAAVLDESNSMPRTFSSYWCNFCVIRHCNTPCAQLKIANAIISAVENIGQVVISSKCNFFNVGM